MAISGQTRQTRFKLKRSNISNNIPTTSQLLLGELALNTADVKLYGGYTGGLSGATEIRQIGWDRVSKSGDTMTGPLYGTEFSANTISATTFFGDGSNLTGIVDVYTTGSTITGNTVFFNRTDGLSAYTVDMSGLANLPTDEEIRLFTNETSNGVIVFEGFSANTLDTSKFDVGAIKGWHVDNTTDPENPTINYINYTGSTGTNPSGITLTYLATNPVTYIAIDKLGNIIQSQTEYTPQQTRDYIELGVIVHSDNTVVNAVNNHPVVTISTNSQLYDLMESIGIFNDNGNVYTANGSNLLIDKTTGDIFAAGSNFVTSNKNPHITETPADVGLTFRYRLQDSTEYSGTTNIDPNNYDLGGVLTPVPVNKITIQRIVLFSSNITRIQYGQNVYNTIAEAKDNLEIEDFVVEPNMDENGLLRGFLIVREGTTDLSVALDAVFIAADKFGTTLGAGGASVTSLQKAYDNSINPEIITDLTHGAIELRSGTGDETDHLIEFQSSGGTVNAWVDGNGDSSFNSVSATTISGDTFYGDGSNLTGIVATWDGRETITAGENLSAGDLVYLASGGTYLKASNTAESTSSTELRISISAITSGSTGPALIQGQYTTTGLTSGDKYWLGATAGTYTNVQPSGNGDIVRYIGTALDSTTFEFMPDETWIEISSSSGPSTNPNYRAVTTSTSILNTDFTIDVTTTADTTQTLPLSTSLNVGKVINVKNSDSSSTSTITMNTSGGQLIDGQYNNTTTITFKYPQSLTFQSTGSGWILI